MPVTPENRRRVLVIGSQCDALPNSVLTFLPSAAQQLYEVMTHPDRGGCLPALGPSNGLVIDPTVENCRRAIKSAIRRSSENGATLFLAFIGHGEYVGSEFFLLLKNSDWPPSRRRAVPIASQINELLRESNGLDGLVLVLDACHSGLGALQAAKQWTRTVGAAGGRFEVLTSADARGAFDGCFTATLADVLWSGDPNLSKNLRAIDLQPLIQSRCGNRQSTIHLSFSNGQRFFGGDDGLWLGRNAGWRSESTPLSGAPVWSQIERLTSWFEATPQLELVLARSREHRLVSIIGAAGTGKSTLAAGLCRSELADDIVPARFVNALALASAATSHSDLADELAKQLSMTVPEFAQARNKFETSTSTAEWNGLDAFERSVTGPLRTMTFERTVRIIVDALDQLNDVESGRSFIQLAISAPWSKNPASESL